MRASPRTGGAFFQRLIPSRAGGGGCGGGREGRMNGKKEGGRGGRRHLRIRRRWPPAAGYCTSQPRKNAKSWNIPHVKTAPRGGWPRGGPTLPARSRVVASRDKTEARLRWTRSRKREGERRAVISSRALGFGASADRSIDQSIDSCWLVDLTFSSGVFEVREWMRDDFAQLRLCLMN